MAPNGMIARWLRPALALFALGGLLALGGCGGGSGAPNNPYQPGPPTPGPLSVLPPIITAFSNTPVTLTISGGAAPFFVVSSNPAVLPVAQSPSGNTIVLLPGTVTVDTAVTITVQDAVGQRATSTVTIKAAPIFGTLTIKPSSSACGANICSGQTGTASVTVTGPGGVGIPGRQVRFDVVDGDFAIQSNNPGAPLVPTLTAVSDGNGVATVFIQANLGAPTQPATLRATELTSGNQVNGQFTIVQTTALSVLPGDATITAPDNTGCLGGFTVVYTVFGGTPPYSASTSVPNAVTIQNGVNIPFGGSFTAITTGVCANPATIIVVDATGQTTTATLHNLLGPAGPPPPVPPVTVDITPGSYTTASGTGCTGQTFGFIVSGGVAPYNVAVIGGTATPMVVPASPGSFNITGLTDSSGSHTIVVGDASSPQVTSNAKVTCKP
ncbi:MAG TPA: hypothetical protein VHT22_09635 [Casimicrobiaceae bacterium]|nr:hypothetical protein [Casimicrobiaceae bacterium]